MKNYRMILTILSLILSIINLSLILGIYSDVQKVKENLYSSQKETSTIRKTYSDVSLKVKEGTLKNTGATFILKNNSDVSIIYGNPYWIEKETDGKWSKVRTVEDMNFTLPAFGLQPKETKEFKIDFEYGYGKLSSGKYRLVKDIDVEYEDDTRESFYVTAEFTIN